MSNRRNAEHRTGRRWSAVLASLVLFLGVGTLTAAPAAQAAHATQATPTTYSAPAPINLNDPRCPNLIKQNESDGCVVELQNLLNQHGNSLVPDGIFGPATFSAVEAFQTANGLGVDGIVGPNTKYALYHGGGTPTTVDCVLPPGTSACATGDAVAARAVTVAHYMYDPPTSDDQAADQASFDDTYNNLDYSNSHATYQLGHPAPQTAYGPGLANVPYAWGGGHWNVPGPHTGTCAGYTGNILPCPADQTVGFDCSGLVRWLYAVAGGKDILGNGSTRDQIHNRHLRAVSPGADYANLRPGDLIYYGPNLNDTKHVALYVGTEYVAGEGTGPAMIQAAATGTNVRIDLVSTHANAPIGFFRVTGDAFAAA
ncbi:peptidoglycan-binding protein [Embleya sp. AB8]|uniref:peptidoglycan-binding protein n=1 Tax=Embleya sp. AB8 TaxID=3156304 RepID=UPI003C7236BD